MAKATSKQKAAANKELDSVEKVLGRETVKVVDLGEDEPDVSKLNSLQHNDNDELFFITGDGSVIQLTINESGEMAIANINIINKDTEVILNVYELLLTDAGTAMEFTPVGSNIEVPIPTNNDVPFPVGTVMMIFNRNVVGSDIYVRISPGTEDVLMYTAENNNGSLIRPGGWATLIKKSANTWYVNGNLTD